MPENQVQVSKKLIFPEVWELLFYFILFIFIKFPVKLIVHGNFKD